MQSTTCLHRLLPLVGGALLATLAAAPSAHAQTAVTTWAQSYGTASYDSNGQPGDGATTGNDDPSAIAPMPDGGVVVGGQLGLFEYIGDSAAGAGIVRYDRNGAIVWQTLLRQDNDVVVNGVFSAAVSQITWIRTDAAGNIFVAGGNGEDDNGGFGPFIAKFTPDGTLVWQANVGPVYFQIGTDDQGNPTYIPDTPTGAPTSMDLTSDGGVIIGTQTYAPEVGVEDDAYILPMLVKVNADGSPGFHREYLNPTRQYSSVVSVCQRPDGPGYAMLLAPASNPELDSGGSVVVVLTDAAGNPVQQACFFGNGGTFITPDASGGYFVLGVANIGYGGSEVRKLRADLTPVWQKVLSLPSPYDYLAPAATLTPTSDGGCILNTVASSAALGGTNGAASVLLLTLDGTGAIASAPMLGGPIGEGPSGNVVGTDNQGSQGILPCSCLTTDGAIAFAVSTYSYAINSTAHPDWWVVKANANGQVPGFADTMYNAPASDFIDADSTEAPSVASSDYGPVPVEESPDGLFSLGTEPALIQENLATETGLNAITVKFQANPVTGTAHPAFFAGESSLGSGVYYLTFPSGNPFGYYSFLPNPAYIYHFDLGYEYVFDANDSNSGVYLYDFASSDFFYTSPGFPFPYLYDFGLQSTVYYYPDPNNAGHYNTNGVRYFYVFSTGQIISK